MEQMTWEWAFLLAVISVCVSYILVMRPQTYDQSEETIRIWKVLDEMGVRLQKIENENESLHKLADETKKLLSQQNLAQSLRGQR